MALAAFGILASIFVNMVVGPFHQGQWLGLFLALAFSLALLLEIARGANQSPTLLAAIVAGVAILVVSAVLLAWEAAVFMLVFLAIWLLS